MVEHFLAKEGVASSNLVSRFSENPVATRPLAERLRLVGYEDIGKRGKCPCLLVSFFVDKYTNHQSTRKQENISTDAGD